MSVISDGLVRPGTGSRGRLSRAQLSEVVAGTAARADHWCDLVRYDPARRWYRRMELTQEYEIWLLTWQPGQHTGFHDHGEAAGAFAVVLGELQENGAGARQPDPRGGGAHGHRRRGPAFGPRHVHEVGNDSAAPAVSVHAYSPPLTAMRRYEMTPSGLRCTAPS